MLFSGIPFLFYFLPIVLLLYFAVPDKLKNTVLLFASLFFYGWGEPRMLPLMVISILNGYGVGIVIAKETRTRRKRLWLLLSLAVNILVLGYFKYADFFLQSFGALTGLSVPLLRVTLPIGISFYTFQLMSYSIDVYRGSAAPQKNMISFAAYIAMFPQLIAGPIVRYTEIEAQLIERTHSWERFDRGMRRFIVGLGKKVLLANQLGLFCAAFRTSGEKTVLYHWLYALAFSLQIYYDFSGYSDMAIGLGGVFGFNFPENFRYPYISSSISEFWRRWHISLGGWFRDYVYIPLGGNRCGNIRWLCNILIVWALTGLWHGAACNFILWGLYFAVFLSVEKFFLKKYLEIHRLFSHFYTLFFVLISFVIFNADSISQAWSYFSAMFGPQRLPLSGRETLYHLRSYAVTFLIAAIGCTPLPRRLFCKLSKQPWFSYFSAAASVLMLLLCAAYLVDGSYNPFLYFRF